MIGVEFDSNEFNDTVADLTGGAEGQKWVDRDDDALVRLTSDTGDECPMLGSDLVDPTPAVDVDDNRLR